MKNYYDILDVDEKSDNDTIKKSYRKLASKHHPDKGGSESKFKEINEAYEVLSDSKKKQTYDNQRNMNTMFGDGFSKNGETRSYHYSTGDGPGGIDMKNIFENVFNFTQKNFFHQKPHHNKKTMTSVTINLKDAYTGCHCIVGEKSVHIPAGVKDGQRFYLDGELVEVAIRPHKRFKRSGNDLYANLGLDAFDAMLGAQGTFDHIDGSVLKVTVPAGVQNGQRLHLSGKGMLDIEKDTRGSLYLKVEIGITDNLTENEKDAIIDIWGKIKARKKED